MLIAYLEHRIGVEYRQMDNNNAGVQKPSYKDVLHRTDGDLYIFFLVGNGVLYWDPVDAPWYSAHTPGPRVRSTTGDGGVLPTYIPETGCGPLGGSLRSIIDATPLFNASVKDFNSGDTTTESGSRLFWFANLRDTSATMMHVVRTLGPRALASQSKLYEGMQKKLPKLQWQLDTTQIFASSLAGLQAMFLYSPYNHLEWNTNSVLQLQRLGYEGVPGKRTTGEKCPGAVPVTQPGDVLTDPLNLSDATHSTLARGKSGHRDGSRSESLSAGDPDFYISDFSKY
ncbi:hypothetical protein GGS20DRAFT_598498 [Poronia punctata]|nr:hypothetical protein GGS20DRAFT_598498 [Poronia punctata]